MSLVPLAEQVVYNRSYTPGVDDKAVIDGVKKLEAKVKQLEAEVLALASNQ